MTADLNKNEYHRVYIESYSSKVASLYRIILE